MKTVFVLCSDGSCYGVYSSLRELKKGVDYHLSELKSRNIEQVLSYIEYGINYSPEPLGWDWAYIPVGSDPIKLGEGGGYVPYERYWGMNLIGIKWEHDE